MWIRSQDRQILMICNRLYWAKYKDKFRIIQQDTIFYECDDYDVLGEYETEERVEEILDEIHTHLEILEKAKLGIVKCDINDSIVYQMPKS